MCALGIRLATAATTKVAPPEGAGSWQTFADLLLAKGDSRSELGRHWVTWLRRFSQPLAKHPNLRHGNQRHEHESLSTPTQRIMKPKRHGKHERAPADHASDTANRFAQRQFLGSKHRDRSPRQQSVH